MRKGRDREHMGNTLKTTLLLAVLTVLFVLVGKAIGGESGMVFAFGLAVVMNVGSYWFSDKIVLRMYSAREVTESESPQLHGMVRRLAPAARGVRAHEMAHVRNRDILIGTVAATLAGAIMMLANFARFAAIFGGGRDDREGGGGLQLLVMGILAPLAGMMVQMGASRSREYLADETGARFCGKPDALARALEKISGRSRQGPVGGAPATAHMFIISPLPGGGCR